MYIYISRYRCIYIYMYIYTYIHVRVNIYTYIHMFNAMQVDASTEALVRYI
jgi:hypothetical protein